MHWMILQEQLQSIKVIPLVHTNRCTVHLKLSGYTKALSDFTTAIRLQPDLAEAYLNRSAVYSALGNTKRAKEDIDQARNLTKRNDAYTL